MSNHSAKNRQDLMTKLTSLGQMGSTETAFFHQKVAESVDLGVTDIKAITVLLKEGKMTAGEIAQRLSLTTGAVTNLIDRLEKRGFVSREAHPTDRRRVLVKADDRALVGTTAGNTYESMGKSYTRLLSKYSVEQLEMLVDYHEQQIAITRQEISKLEK